MDLAPGFNFFSSSVCSCPVQPCGSPGMLSEGMSAWQGAGTRFPWQPARVWGAGKCPGQNQLQGGVEKSHVVTLLGL